MKPKHPERSIFDDLPEAYFQVDLKGNFIYANATLHRLHAGPHGSLIGKNFRRLATPKSARKTMAVFYGIFCTGAPGRISDVETTDANQQRHFIEISAALLRDNEGEPIGFQGIAFDRTEEKGTNSELDRYRDFVESIEDGCFEVDLDGTMTFFNEAMCKIHGYPYHELLGMNHRSFASPEDTKRIYKTFNQVYSTGIPSKILDYTIIRKDGSTRHLEVSASLIRDGKGHAVGFRGITRDRTEKKRKELELERYRQFIENVDDACFEVDLKGNMTFFNRATVDNFGYPAERLTGINNREYTSPETAKRIFAIYQQIYKTGRPGNISDYEVFGADGKKRYLNTTASLITDSNGRAVGFRGISRDVTDQHTVVRDNERLADLLHQLRRLEAISTLAAGVAHNFNNLLMSIQGNVSLIKMDTADGHPNMDRIEIIQEKIQKGAQFTTQLFNYANINNRAAVPTDINRIIQDAAARFKNSSGPVRMVEHYAEALPLTPVDSHQVEHVMANLFANALQAMPEGGTIEISTEKMILTQEFTQPYGRDPGPYVRIVVSDTGKGMDEQTRQHIFEPFFTTKKNCLGAGLGLASAHGIVKSYHGIIEVDSLLGKGTRISIYLPAVSETAAKRPHPVESSKKHKTILLVEDEKITMEMMCKWLEKSGYDVIRAQSGQEALEIFHSDHAKIDLVIMDVVMPGIGGDEALTRMGRIVPEMKAILISGFIDGSRHSGILQTGRQAFFQKPIDYESLAEAIETLLDAGSGLK